MLFQPVLAFELHFRPDGPDVRASRAQTERPNNDKAKGQSNALAAKPPPGAGRELAPSGPARSDQAGAMPCFVCAGAAPRSCGGGCNRELCLGCAFTLTSVGQLMCADCGVRHKGLPAPPPPTRKRGFDLGFLAADEDYRENENAAAACSASPVGARGRRHSGKDLRSVQSAPGSMAGAGAGCAGAGGWDQQEQSPQHQVPKQAQAQVQAQQQAAWSALTPWQQQQASAGWASTGTGAPIFGAAACNPWAAPSPAPLGPGLSVGVCAGVGADDDVEMDADL